MHLFPLHGVVFDEKILILPSGQPILVHYSLPYCLVGTLAAKHGRSRWRHCQTPKALLASMLTDEGRGTDARNNQTVLRAEKINTEGNLYLARTDDQEIKTSDDKMLCPDGIYL